MKTLPPAHKVQQAKASPIVQRGVRQAADPLTVKVTIDPADLPAGFMLDHAEGTLGGVGGLCVDDMEPHDRASSRKDWNCRVPPPWTKKELGS
jgi:hypothetical protein